MMVRIQRILAALLAALIFVVPVSAIAAADASSAEIEQLKKDIEQLRKQLQGSSTAMPRSSVDTALAGKYGPNAAVTTKSGKLNISGLLQVWYYHIQKDNRALWDGANGGAVFDTNTASDCDSFRIRRSELTFTMDIHENVTAVVRIDPAREATSFPGLPDNQGGNLPGAPASVFKVAPNVSPEWLAAEVAPGSATLVGNVQTGSGAVPRLLKDAYINYHGVVPHHDFTVGQFRPQIGEEGPRSSAELEFVERSMIGQLTEDRDLGMQMHGSWWDDRFQYWLGGFDSAGGYFQTNMNRADTNSDKDFLVSFMVRPLWKSETWGSLELGYSFECGTHGKVDFLGRDIGNAYNDINIQDTFARRMAAYGSYRPGGPVKGWWFRGEWQLIHDRAPAGVVFDIAGGGFPAAGGVSVQKPFNIQGFYVATGYKLSDSVFADSAPSWLKPWEFAFRYEQLQNVWTINDGATDPLTEISAYRTKVYTAGINYYIKGHNAKIQLDYNVVLDPQTTSLNAAAFGKWHKTKNDNLMVNFQVAF